MKSEHKAHILLYGALISFLGINFSSFVIVEFMTNGHPIYSLFGALLSVLFGYTFVFSVIGFEKERLLSTDSEGGKK